jgi:thiamine biosynthesis lipoprotein
MGVAAAVEVEVGVGVAAKVNQKGRDNKMIDNVTWGWYGLGFRAMNTEVEVQLYAEAGEDHAEAVEGVQRMFDTAEERMSRFKPDSELSRLNRSAGSTRRVSPLLFDVVEAAVWAASITGGIFDPTLLKAMEAIGYDRSFEQIGAGSDGEATVTARGQYWTIDLDRPRQEITLPSGVGLDLGGIGKGWTVDRAADWLAGHGPFLINAGGDLYAYGTPPGQAGWSIGVADPWEMERDSVRVQVRQMAVVTSTTSRRHWQRGERTMHHLVDPRTGQPAATDAVSVTVIAPRAALAEVYAKAALILGVEAGQAWLNRIPDVEGLLVREDGQLVYTDGFTNYLEVTDDNSDANQPGTLPAGEFLDSDYRRERRGIDRVALAGAGTK